MASLQPRDTDFIRVAIHPTPLVELDRVNTHDPLTANSPQSFGVFVPHPISPDFGEGHFTCCLVKDNGSLYYFDPLGKNTGLRGLKKLFEKYKWDKRLISQSKLQSNLGQPTQDARTHTCGDHVIERLRYKNQTHREFISTLKKIAQQEGFSK